MQVRKLGTSIFLLAWLAGSALAQPSPEEHKKVNVLFAEGRDLLMVKKDYKAACEKFEAAIAIDPTAPGVMLNLGLCYEYLTKYATSLYWFRRAQAAAAEGSAKDAQLKDYEDAARTHTIDLAGKVTTAKIDISTAPPDVAITIDGRPVLASEYQRVEVDTDSVIEARAKGKQRFRYPIEVKGQDAGTIQVVMVDAPEGALVDPGKGRRRMAFIIGIGGAVVAAAGGGYAVYVKRQFDDMEIDYDKAQFRMRWIGTGAIVVGVGALAVGGFLYWTSPSPYREEQTSFAPVIGPDQLGFVYGGSF
jgi:tetratricopeptide (TPR) repeat protein